MENLDVNVLLTHLSESIDELEEELSPILQPSGSLSQVAKQLCDEQSSLDKAKFYVLIAYTIESLLFSSLRLSNASNVKSHAVYSELARVRQYFDKVQMLESIGKSYLTATTGKRENLCLDKQAAARIINHALRKGNYNSKSTPYDNQSQQQRATLLGKRKLLEQDGAERSAGKTSIQNSREGNILDENVEAREGTSQSNSEPAKVKKSRHDSHHGHSHHHRRHRRKHGKNDNGKDVINSDHETSHKKRPTKSSRSPKSSHAVFESLLNR